MGGALRLYLLLKPPYQFITESNWTLRELMDRDYRFCVGKKSNTIGNEEYAQGSFDSQAHSHGNLASKLFVYQRPIRFKLSRQQDDVYFTAIKPQQFDRQRDGFPRPLDCVPICLSHFLGTGTTLAFLDDFLVN